MKENVFPVTYNETLKKELDNAINTIDNNSQKSIEKIKKRNFSFIQTLEAEKEGLNGQLHSFFFFSALGLYGGFVPCSYVCYKMIDTQEDYFLFSEVIIPLGTWLLTIIIGFAIDFIINSFKDENTRSKILMIDNQIDAANKDLNIEIQKIRQDAKNQIQIYKNSAKESQERYPQEFENKVQKLSVQFAESTLAKQVIAWMTAGFEKHIDATDRRPHIEQISVPFQFRVFTNQITCNIGTYDFELNRCRNLKDPVEQTALARAIASAIQLNIMMKYPVDPSGTQIEINIDYSYSPDSPIVTITYLAVNGNYKAVESW